MTMLTKEQIEQIDNMNYNDRDLLAYNTDNTDILEYLSNDECWGVRYEVVKNTHAPIDILVKLSDDEDSDVRYVIAKSTRVSIDILVKLSSDKNGVVRYFVACNVNTPKHILKKLSNDENEDVCDEANEQLAKYNINIDKHTTKGILE